MAEQSQSKTLLPASVIICTYSDDRWDFLEAAVRSVQDQEQVPQEIVLVIDHNPPLAHRASEAFPGVKVVENAQRRGLSGARNTGVDASQGDIIAFLDDDATADPAWLTRLHDCYKDERVLGAGGAATPLWMSNKPRWFPDEFGWVVGCSYRGQPQSLAPVRNLLGCNMSFQREVFQAVGGFQHGLGRVGQNPVGCEETELCIRLRQRWPDARVMLEPRAQVLHRVTPTRGTWRYFRDRCFAEGRSKAVVAHLVGSDSGLESERAYALRILTSGAWQGVRDTFARRDAAHAAKAAAIVAGLAITTAGYAAGQRRASQGMGAA